MAIVSVDDRGRLTIPKELGIRGTRAIIIPVGSFFVAIPLPDSPLEAAEGWLETDKTREQLKASAERLAADDAVSRVRRRDQA